MANKNPSGNIAADAEIASRIKALIEESGTSENALAEAVGISQPTMNRRLKGVGSFNVQEVGRIADVFQTAPSRLVMA